MKLQSIIWLPLALMLAGCGESASDQSPIAGPVIIDDHGEMVGLFGLELGFPIDSNNSKRSEEAPQQMAGVRPEYVVTPPLPSEFFSKYDVGTEYPSSGIVYITASHRSANQSIATTFDAVERQLKSQIGQPDEVMTGSRNGTCEHVWHQTLRSGQTVELRLTKWDEETFGSEKEPGVILLSLLTTSGGVRAVSGQSKMVKRSQTRATDNSQGLVASTPSTAKHEITGMFGLKLGDELPTQLVRKLDGWREWAEAGVYSVTPPQPSEVFDSYMVHLLGGPIYKIQASRNGRGQALVHFYDDAQKELVSQFGPPTFTDAVDDRGDHGMAWEQNLRSGGRVRMTLALRKDSNAGYVVPGWVMLEIQRL